MQQIWSVEDALYRSLSICLLFLMILAACRGETVPGEKATDDQGHLAYEVVSIRPAGPILEFKGADDSADGTRIINSLKALVGYAYEMRPDFVSCSLKWCDSALFDIRGKVAEADIPQLAKLSSEQRGVLLRSVLLERFGLRFHRETRTVPVFEVSRCQRRCEAVSAPNRSAARAGPTFRWSHHAQEE